MEKLTRFEKTRIISARALQLSLGAPSLVKVGKNQTMIEIAEAEFAKGVIGLTILRTFPNGEVKKIEIV